MVNRRQVPTGGAEVEAMDEVGDKSDPEQEEEEAEERKGAAGGLAPRGGKSKARGVNKAGAQTEKTGEGSGKGDKTRKSLKGKRKEDGDGEQENGASGANGTKGKAGKKGGAKKSKQQAGGKAGKLATKSGKPGPLSDDTPAASNTVAKDAATPTASPSPSPKVKNKAKSPKKKAKGGETPEGKKDAGEASLVEAKSAAKRKHKVGWALVTSERPLLGSTMYGGMRHFLGVFSDVLIPAAVFFAAINS